MFREQVEVKITWQRRNLSKLALEFNTNRTLCRGKMATGIQAEMACTESRSDYDSDKYSHLHCSEVAPAIRRLIIIGPFHIMC